MECNQALERLVAHEDGELGASEAALLERHLSACPDCAAQVEALYRTRPEPSLAVPLDVQLRMEQAVQAALEAGLSQLPPAPVLPIQHRAQRWMQRDAQISRGALLAWAATFAAVLGWGLANWAALQGASHAPSVVSVEVPADQYQPASFQPVPTDADWH